MAHGQLESGVEQLVEFGELLRGGFGLEANFVSLGLGAGEFSRCVRGG